MPMFGGASSAPEAEAAGACASGGFDPAHAAAQAAVATTMDPAQSVSEGFLMAAYNTTVARDPRARQRAARKR
jgi:hypothetical protein